MIKTALIGFGLAGKVFHAPLLEANKALELTTILSTRTEEILELYPKVIVEKDFETILNSDIELIVIATPNHLHFEQAKKALKAKKNVVVDKPFTVTVAEARELVELARQNDVLLSVFHNRRFDGDFLTLKKILEGNTLGRIVSFETNFNRFRPSVNTENWRETTDIAGGVFFDLAPHLIDQVVSLFGPPVKVFCDLDLIRDNVKNDDYFHLIFQYEKMRVHLNASTVAKNNRERFVLQGTKGSFSKFGLDPQENNLKKGMLGNNETLGKDIPELYGNLSLENEDKIIETIPGNYNLYYENIAESIFDRNKLEVTSEEALFTMELLELCMESYHQQKWIEV